MLILSCVYRVDLFRFGLEVVCDGRMFFFLKFISIVVGIINECCLIWNLERKLIMDK